MFLGKEALRIYMEAKGASCIFGKGDTENLSRNQGDACYKKFGKP